MSADAGVNEERAVNGEVLKLTGLTVARGGRDVVRNVSLEIPPAEVTASVRP